MKRACGGFQKVSEVDGEGGWKRPIIVRGEGKEEEVLGG